MLAFSRCGLSLRRYRLIVPVVMCISMGVAWADTNGDPQVAPGGITLRQTLEKGLKARRKSEFAFIALVVKKVEQGQLPKKMVERTFLWARDHRQPYPMPYFEKAMQIQAKKLRVELPFTDT
jgi:hypothetical protein